MYQIFDALILIQDSGAWTGDDDTQLTSWMGDYLDWLLTSDIGVAAGEELFNNHLTYHALHLATIGGYLGNRTLMEMPLLDAASSNFSVYHLIDTQISSNGSMPFETVRHHAYHYQLFDLTALILLSQYTLSIGKSAPFGYTGPTGSAAQSISGSINYLFPPTYDPTNGWPHSTEEIAGEIPKFARILYIAESLNLYDYPSMNWAFSQDYAYPQQATEYNSSLTSIHSYTQISKALGYNLAATHDMQLLWYDVTPYVVEIVWLSVAGDIIVGIIGMFMFIGLISLISGIVINIKYKREYRRLVIEKDKRCGCAK
ncbi:hypothetical protein HK100_007702 [Physocladia obscura]|uniref:Alginate lyase domain-containing protein n=1 Tax=Physocladia obscura TaxID=109957 RepID=A0AAD5XI67_9FUNG|nr:hypothetical protein HK100_007702 [Physocladia obscura]